MNEKLVQFAVYIGVTSSTSLLDTRRRRFQRSKLDAETEGLIGLVYTCGDRSCYTFTRDTATCASERT